MRVIISEEFARWVKDLPDRQAALNVSRRAERIKFGNLGRTERLTPRVSEIKIDMGKGYRIYYSKLGDKVVMLLIGGNKSTQNKDIKKAEEILKKMLEEMEED